MQITDERRAEENAGREGRIQSDWCMCQIGTKTTWTSFNCTNVTMWKFNLLSLKCSPVQSRSPVGHCCAQGCVFTTVLLCHFYRAQSKSLYDFFILLMLLWHWPLVQTWQSFLLSAGTRSHPQSLLPQGIRGDPWSHSPVEGTVQTSQCFQIFCLWKILWHMDQSLLT